MVFILETVLLSLNILVNSLSGKVYLFYCFVTSLIYQLHFQTATRMEWFVSLF